VKQAIQYLPLFLKRAHAIGDEVVEFTEKGGWQKIDDALLRVTGGYGSDLTQWTRILGHFTWALEVSHFFLRRGNL
jgi:hypothetical protein